MSELVTELIKIIAKYGWWTVLAIVFISTAVWVAAHRAASPGETVEIVWGLVKYTKQLSDSSDTTKHASETKSKPVHTQDQSSSSPEFGEIIITITQPENNVSVSQFIDVEYSIEGVVPNGYRPVLVVRDPLGQYWSWGNSPSNRHVNVQIGVARDRGRDFEIGIIITSEELPLNEPRRSLTQGIAYNSILVTRQ